MAASRMRVDLAAFLLLGLLAAAICLINHAMIDPQVYRSFNIYFQADPPRVISNMTEAWSPMQNRTVAHPLFSILTLSAVKALGLLGLEPMAAIRLLLALCAAASAGGFFAAMRLLGLGTAVAGGFTLALMASAGFLHWYPFVETYAFSATSISLMLIFTCSMRRLPLAGWAAASAGTLAMLITNWGLGLASAFFRLSFRHFLIVSAAAFLIVSAGSVIQMQKLHRARYFLDPRSMAKEKTYSGPALLAHGMPWSPWVSARNGLLLPGVATRPVREDAPTEKGPFTLINNQFTPLATLGLVGGVAVLAWIGLLAGGIGAMAVDRERRSIGYALLMFLGFQIAFHSWYGEITFLYAADLAPVALALAALGWFAPWRKAVAAALALFIVTGAVNNEGRFRDAARLSNRIAIDKLHGRAVGK
ncbi:MAG: hypothetical protein QM690_16390 [Sphingobium sp.]